MLQQARLKQHTVDRGRQDTISIQSSEALDPTDQSPGSKENTKQAEGVCATDRIRDLEATLAQLSQENQALNSCVLDLSETIAKRDCNIFHLQAQVHVGSENNERLGREVQSLTVLLQTKSQEIMSLSTGRFGSREATSKGGLCRFIQSYTAFMTKDRGKIASWISLKARNITALCKEIEKRSNWYHH